MSLGERFRRDWPAWLVGAVLVLAGLLKTGRPLPFGRIVEGYRVLPALAVPAVAVVLPWLEVLVGALLCATQLRLGAAAAATALSGGFLLAGGSVLIRGLETECGCFGGWSGSVGLLSLAIEVALFGAAVTALRRAWQHTRPGSPRG